MMHLYGVAKTDIERETTAQFRQSPETGRAELPAAPRAGLVTTLRARLSADLRALAAAIEPRQPLTPHTGASHR
jgi:hypothetical protein